MSGSSYFDRSFGIHSGRIIPTGWTAPEGSYAFVLGSDVEGQTGNFTNGDMVWISQDGPVVAGDYVRVRVRTRCPAIPSLPNPYHWELWADANLGVRVARILPTDTTFDPTDVSFHVGDLAPSPPDRSLAFALRFVGNPGDIYYDVEIPAVYLDYVEILTAPARMMLLNRDAGPSETDVPHDGLIGLDVVDSGNVGVDLTGTKVWINGALAYNGAAGFVSPFDGAGSAQTSPYVYAERLIFEYTDPSGFASESTVTVEVQSETTDGLATLTDSYSFTIEDYTDPSVVEARARTQRVVRVTFDEAMTMSDPTDVADALNPSNYVLTGNEVPAFVPGVSSVSAVSATEVDLTLDDDLSFERSYRITVSGTEDVSGNGISLMGNTADFVSPGTGFPAARRFDLWRMLPEANRRRDREGTGDLRKFITCLQEAVDLLLGATDRWSDILDIDLDPESFVDAMLWELGNPFEFDLDLDDKRRLGKTLLAIYREKGTASGIENAVLFFLGLVVTVDPYLSAPLWILDVSELGVGSILGPGTRRDRYTFDVVSGIALTDEQRLRITDIARYMKCAHEHLGRIVEPSAPLPTYWTLGESELEVDTALGG